MAYKAGEMLVPYVSAVKHRDITPLKASRGYRWPALRWMSFRYLSGSALAQLIIRISGDLEHTLNAHFVSMQIHTST